MVKPPFHLRSYALMLLLLYAFVLVKPVLPYVDYMFRKDFIIRNLCENREKPEMQCNGQCHLEKQVKKESDEAHDSEAPMLPRNAETEIQECLVNEEEEHKLVQVESPVGPVVPVFYSYQYVPSVFHPPMQA